MDVSVSARMERWWVSGAVLHARVCLASRPGAAARIALQACQRHVCQRAFGKGIEI